MPLQVPTKLTLKNLLLATDFTPVSETALPFAIAIARRFESTIHVVHVLSHGELQPAPESAPVELDRNLLVEAEREMRELMCSTRFESVPHEGKVQPGTDVFAEIAKLIEADDIDLVVLGTHGREGISQMMLGSVAETVFRMAPCPVLTVGPKVAPKKAAEVVFRQILFATDLTQTSLKALPFVQAFADENQAQLLVAHVAQETVHGREERVLAEESTRRWMREWIPPQPNLEYVVGFGSPAEALLEVIFNRRPDLVMLGAHHAPGFATHLPGAVAHRMVSEATCPVLTVHWKEASRAWPY